jgi:hypothetical protein
LARFSVHQYGEMRPQTDRQKLVLTALRVLADEAVRGSDSDPADELTLRNASDEASRFLPIRELARQIIDRESRALGWRTAANASEVFRPDL